MSPSRVTRWWCSRVSPAPGSPRWPLAPSMPRPSGATSSRWPLCAATDRLGRRTGRRCDRRPTAGGGAATAAGPSNARSSVGSVTTLSSLVRMMYSRAGAYPANQPMLYAEDFSPNTPQERARPATAWPCVRADRGQHGARSLPEHPRAGDRLPPPGKARTCATSQSAWATTLTDRGRTCRRRIATGFCSPRKHRRCRCTPASRLPRPAPRSNARWSRATWAPSPAPDGICCTPLPTPRAR